MKNTKWMISGLILLQAFAAEATEPEGAIQRQWRSQTLDSVIRPAPANDIEYDWNTVTPLFRCEVKPTEKVSGVASAAGILAIDQADYSVANKSYKKMSISMVLENNGRLAGSTERDCGHKGLETLVEDPFSSTSKADELMFRWSDQIVMLQRDPSAGGEMALGLGVVEYLNGDAFEVDAHAAARHRDLFSLYEDMSSAWTAAYPGEPMNVSFYLPEPLVTYKGSLGIAQLSPDGAKAAFEKTADLSCVRYNSHTPTTKEISMLAFLKAKCLIERNKILEGRRNHQAPEQRLALTESEIQDDLENQSEQERDDMRRTLQEKMNAWLDKDGRLTDLAKQLESLKAAFPEYFDRYGLEKKYFIREGKVKR